ncbi:hypothetical protein L6R53_14550 [Myxococcota bacterium]|nr:hypothetical protein [Myxococcota bacterium]
MLGVLLGIGLAAAAEPRHDGVELQGAPAAWAAAALARATGLELLVVGGGAPVDLELPAGPASAALQAVADAAGLVHQVVPTADGELHLVLPSGAAADPGGRAPRGRLPPRDVVAVGLPAGEVRELLGGAAAAAGAGRVTAVLHDTPPDLARAWLERVPEAEGAPVDPPPPLGCATRDPLALVPCVPLDALSLIGVVAGPRPVALLGGPDGLLLAEDGDSLAVAEALPDRLARWQLLLREGKAALHLGAAQARTLEIGRRGATLCTPAEQVHLSCTVDGTGERVALCEADDLWTFRVGSAREDRWSVTGLGATGPVRRGADGAVEVTARLHQARLSPQPDGSWRYQEAGGPAGPCRR